MAKQLYHKYVFDEKNRKFVGKFEKMYQNEDKENYDSWFQEDLTDFGKQVSLTILNKYNFNSILDIGCGKGVFTQLLKKVNNHITGVDISKTAIKKAKLKYKGIEFLRLTAEEILKLKKKWDLIVMMEILSYLRNWKKIIALAAKRTSYIYIFLYIPSNPIGFVKSFKQLKNELNKNFNIETELLQNNECICILAKGKK